MVGIFHYRARNNHAELFTGEVTAENIHAAALQIRSKGLWVVQLDEKIPTLSWQEKLKAFLMQDIHIPGLSDSLGKYEESLFISQLSSMLQANLPLQQALCAMKKYGKHDAYQKLKDQVEQFVSGGRSLHEALGCFPQVFSETVCTCVRAGETSGSLGVILQQLSLYLKKSLKAREKLKSALVYPGLMLSMMIISMFIVATFILPTFANLLANIKGELPWATAVVLEMVNFLGDWWGKFLLLGLLLAVALGAAAAMQEPHCRLRIDKAVLSLPAFGKLVVHAEWLQILGTLGVLLKSGIRLAEALNMVEQVPQNTYLRTCLGKIQRKVEQGQTFTESLALCAHVPWQVRELLAVGEQAGRLEEMFFESAAICQEQAEQKSDRMLVLVEPALTLVLGLFLLFLVMAIIMPVLNVMDVLT